ncbi:tricyclene synthase EBOS, chloroplastic-like [Abrus precatorius]|uniref:Tricyclene synthase EBOS, chloroplastic-like n=1 Tax=Abrus precatorius TaxID=3816 RepID=A0A8B8L0Q2_ABRPR|nr:tricyclene synthase EBOS, chloroplastic-like [Abrus precatorius]
MARGVHGGRSSEARLRWKQAGGIVCGLMNGGSKAENVMFLWNIISMLRFSSTLCCMASTNVSQRKSANYQPNLWNYDFLQSLKHDYADVKYEDMARKMQEEVRSMIRDENAEIWTALELIEDVKRLGLSYHFHKEIREALHRFLSLERCNGTIIHRTLHETALSFRLLREYGYDVSEDIFKSFKDHKGNFKASLRRDVKGMLSLYEASFLSYEGEHIMDEAKAFTSFHLRNLDKYRISSIVLEQVKHALELPLHRRIQRLEARWYIEAYDKRRDANQVVLEAAKLDFNVVQSKLQRDLQEMSGWWNRMGLAPKLSFSRDRLVECFFWSMGMAFEPQFSDLRKGLTKVTSLITTIDDVYDVYGTLDELELFTEAVESWDIKAVQVLPEYMKICFLALYNTVNGLAYDAIKNQGHDILPYLTKAWSVMLKAFLLEAKWCRDKYLPTFDNYLNNAWVSVSGVVILIHAYFLLNPNITKEALDSLENYHDLLRRPSIIFRLCNDLGTSKAELHRGEGASSILFCMRESGVSEESAYINIQGLLDETWKKMNKDRVTYSPFPKSFVETAMNLARISQCTYLNGDGHGAPDSAANDRIRSLIIEPISLRENHVS